MENESNKMTSVQWFIEQLEEKGVAYENVSFRKIQISIDVSDYLELKRQAKQMGKEQIKEAYNYGQQIPPFIYAEQYYEQTYGNNNGE
jgi:hypothetical protein